MTEPIQRLEAALARLGAEHEPKLGWEARVLASIAATDRLEGALGRLGAEHQPRPGWEARVLAATAPRAKRRWWMFAIPAFAVAAVVIAVIATRRTAPPKPLELALVTDRTGPVVRGDTAQLGDLLHATATGGVAHRAVWVFRGERDLVIACPGQPGCRGSSGETIADVTLRAPGTYTIVALTSAAQIPAPRGWYDDDLAAAMRAGAEHTTRTLDVR